MNIGSTVGRVTITMGPRDAHSFGRYLYEEGLSHQDEVAEDGHVIVRESHYANGLRCPDPRDCPFPDEATANDRDFYEVGPEVSGVRE